MTIPPSDRSSTSSATRRRSVGEVLLGDGGAVAAEVEGVDVHVRLGIAAGHRAQVDPVDQLGELGRARVVGVEVDLAVGGQPGEAAGTPHPHQPLVGGRRAAAGPGRPCRRRRHADGRPGLRDRVGVLAGRRDGGRGERGEVGAGSTDRR